MTRVIDTRHDQSHPEFMTGEKIRNLLNANPFRPFQVQLPSGRSVSVPARDFAALSPSGRTMVVLGENESEEVVDVMLIERVQMEGAERSGGN